MFLELTPRAGGEKIHVNLSMVKLMMPDNISDSFGTLLIFDIQGDNENDQKGLAVFETIDEIMEMAEYVG